MKLVVKVFSIFSYLLPNDILINKITENYFKNDQIEVKRIDMYHATIIHKGDKLDCKHESSRK